MITYLFRGRSYLSLTLLLTQFSCVFLYYILKIFKTQLKLRSIFKILPNTVPLNAEMRAVQGACGFCEGVYNEVNNRAKTQRQQSIASYRRRLPYGYLRLVISLGALADNLFRYRFRHFRIVVELHGELSAALSSRTEVGCVTEHFGKGNFRVNHLCARSVVG